MRIHIPESVLRLSGESILFFLYLGSQVLHTIGLEANLHLSLSDAAHTVHPLAGQGLNQGQADAAALVRVIETAVSQGSDIGSQLALEAYTGERWQANNALLGAVDKLHKLYSFGSGPVVPVRSWGLSAVNAIGPLKGWFMRQAAGT